MNGNVNLQAGQVPNFYAGGGQDPEQQRQMMEYFQRVSEMDPQKKAFSRQRAMAEQLRAQAPQARMRVTGGGKTGRPEVVTAAHPLEHLADLARAGVGAYAGYKADKGEDAYGAQRRKAFADVAQRQPQGGYGGAGGTEYGSTY